MTQVLRGDSLLQRQIGEGNRCFCCHGGGELRIVSLHDSLDLLRTDSLEQPGILRFQVLKGERCRLHCLGDK